MIDKLESDNAVEVYTAYNAMLYYNAERAVPLRNRTVDIFERRMMRLVNPYHGAFLDAKDGRFLLYAQEKIQEMVGKWRYSAGVEMRLWYPWNRFDMEVAIAEHELLPLIIYYLHQLWNCGCDLRICDCCGSRFFSRSGHITLCGETCVFMNKKRNEKDHAERTEANRYDKMYKDSRQRMRRAINAFKTRDGVSAIQIEVVEEAYTKIRDEAKFKKKNIKTEEDIMVFQNWLFRQESILDRMCGGA